MRSKASRARVVSAVRAVVEALEERCLLSVPAVTDIQYPAIAAGTVDVPWKNLNPTGSNTGEEQLVASVNGGGVTAVLVQVQAFSKPATLPNGQFGDTSLILYARSGNGPWHEQKIDTALDGLSDRDFDNNTGQWINRARKDGQMVMDGQQNLYVLSSSDTYPSLRIDRISHDKLQALASSGQPITIDQAHDVMSWGESSFRPQIAVGQDPNTTDQTEVYLYYGDKSFPNVGAFRVWTWKGAVSDDFSPGAWDRPLNNDNTSIGQTWAPMTVGYDGKLYVPQGNRLYAMSQSNPAAGFTAVYDPLRHTATGALGYGGYLMSAYTPPAGSGGTPMLWVVTTDDSGRYILASTPMTGVGGGAWTYYDPIDPATGIVSLQLAVDPVTGQPSVMYQTNTGTALNIAVLTQVDPVNGIFRWSRRTVSAPISFAQAPASGTYGNDHALGDWYSAYDGVGAVTWMQNDGSLTSDVAALPVDLNPLIGKRITANNDAGNGVITLGGDAANGSVTVGVDGTSYPFNFSVPVVDVIVNGQSNAALSVTQTATATPVPIFGIEFYNDASDPGTLTVNGAGSAVLSGASLFLSTGAIGLQNVSNVNLDLGAGAASAVSLSQDAFVPTVPAVNVTGGGAGSSVAVRNTSANAAPVTLTTGQVTLQNFAVTYDTSVASIEIDGPNLIPNLDFGAGVLVPNGSPSFPGLIDLDALTQITATPGNDVVEYNNSNNRNYWLIDGQYLAVKATVLRLGGGDDTATLLVSPDLDTEVDCGAGTDAVTFSTGVQGLAHNVSVVGGDGDDTVTQNSQNGDAINNAHLVFNGGSGESTLTFTFPQAAGNGLPQTVFNGGTGANVLNNFAKRGTYYFTTTIDPSWTQRLTVNVAAPTATPPEELVDPATAVLGPVVEFHAALSLVAINIGHAGHVNLATPSGFGVFSSGTLSVTDTGTLDVGGDGLLLDRGNLPSSDSNSVFRQVYGWVASGYHSLNPAVALGDWGGTGIVSGWARTDIALPADQQNGYAVGIWDGSDPGGPAGLPAGKVLVGMAFWGDANGDVIVDNADFAIWRNNFGTGTDWAQGDFNYDQSVDNADYAIWRNHFGDGVW